MTVYSSQFFGGRRFIKRTPYTTGSGTHTWDSATKVAVVTMLGGGAGGAGGGTTSFYQGGGSSGTTIIQIDKTLFPTATYVVGAAGLGGAGLGTDGGFSQFGPYKQLGGNADTNAAGNAASISSKGAGTGVDGEQLSNGHNAGASSLYGTGGQTLGASATGYGAGGAAGTTSGNGTGGLIIVEEYA